MRPGSLGLLRLLSVTPIGAALCLCAAGGVSFADTSTPAACARGVTEANTRALFERLRKARPGDGCALDGVRAERDRIFVTWKKGDAAIEPAVLMPSACVDRPAAKGKELSIAAAGGLAEACPGALAAIGDIIASDALGGLADASGTPAPPPPPPADTRPVRRWIGLAAAGGALIAAAQAGAIWVRRRRAADPQRPPVRWGRLAARTLAVLVAIVAALMMLRAGHPPGHHQANVKFDPRVGWVPDCTADKPGCPLDKVVGQRLDAPDPSKEHIVLLGDSVAYGYGVGDGEHVGAALARRIKDPRYQVLNAAVTGYSIDQYYLYLERILPLVRPRVVVVDVFTGNDYQGTVHDNLYGYTKPLFHLEGDRLAQREPTLKELNCANFVSKSVAFNLLWRWSIWGRGADRSGGRREKVFALVEAICRSRELSSEEGPKVITKLFEAIEALAKGKGAEVVFVLLPRLHDGTPRESSVSEEQWNPPWPTMSFFQRLFQGTPRAVVDFSRILNDRFCHAGAGGAMECDYAGMERLFRDGAHYNAEGNDLLAASIHRALRERVGIE